MNTRPCALCRHLDGRVRPSGDAWCWARYIWVQADGTVADCPKAERANGHAPPGQIRFPGEQHVG